MKRRSFNGSLFAGMSATIAGLFSRKAQAGRDAITAQASSSVGDQCGTIPAQHEVFTLTDKSGNRTSLREGEQIIHGVTLERIDSDAVLVTVHTTIGDNPPKTGMPFSMEVGDNVTFTKTFQRAN